MRLISTAWLDGYYYKPRVDHDVLRTHSEGLIALSGCLGSELSQAILKSNPDKAWRLAEEYRDIFGAENYFFEVQGHQSDNQAQVNQTLREMAAKLVVAVPVRTARRMQDKADVTELIMRNSLPRGLNVHSAVVEEYHLLWDALAAEPPGPPV